MGKTQRDEAYEEGFKAGKEGSDISPPIVDGIEEGLHGLFGGGKHVREHNESYRAGHEEGKRRREDSNAEHESKDNSLCYLTTACVSARGLPDNCFELETLRGFRDRVLVPRSDGRRAVSEYYKIAPEIVRAVDEQDNSQDIWRGLYKDIRHSVSLVVSGDFENAFKHYQQMTMGLKGRFLS
ncbi:hypothetical protein HY448_00135 [Candidatus Pacearchaeota archaeon]|nr:hypothetical protein [Candidatus Pacearchaeota archaeon]